MASTMERRRLGRTGLRVSAIGFGAARLDEHPAQATATVHRALELGVDFIDTARYYGDSEARLGEALGGETPGLVLATKALLEHPDATRRSVETSLSLLRRDAVDLLYAHGCDTELRVEHLTRRGGALESLRALRDEGVARYLGVSVNHFLPFEDGRTGLDRMRALLELDVFDVIQLPMSLLRIERVEDSILPLAAERDVGVVVNFPTVNGLLTRDVGVFAPLLAPHAVTPGQVALLALLLYPQVSSVLSGMSLPAMAEENCAAGHRLAALDTGERDALRARVDAVGVGPCRSCGRCEPHTAGVPVRLILTYHDAVTRYGIEAARELVEEHRQRVREAPPFDPRADQVCPAGLDVRAAVDAVYDAP